MANLVIPSIRAVAYGRKIGTWKDYFQLRASILRAHTGALHVGPILLLNSHRKPN